MQNKWNPIHSLAYKKFISYLLVYKCIPDIFGPTYIRTGQKVIVHTPEMLKKSENKKLRKKNGSNDEKREAVCVVGDAREQDGQRFEVYW